MDEIEITKLVREMPLSRLYADYPYTADFFAGIRLKNIDASKNLPQILSAIPEEYLEDFGLSREELFNQFVSFIGKIENTVQIDSECVRSVTVIGGRDKSGKAENVSLTVKPGEIIGIVGPTGSGKSRLLGDIECLAQRDTPTCRQVLINGSVPDERRRFAVENKLVAQLSQNMNFVMDVTVADFLTMHAESRVAHDTVSTVKNIFECANALAGEKFNPGTTVTQLSGGQSRALMIADTALLSNSPVVLIDEIENAGIDRRKAVELLAQKEKIVLMSTHDPLLALMADKRVVIKNGGISRVVETSAAERTNMAFIEEIDNRMTGLRNLIRTGRNIDFDVAAYFIDDSVRQNSCQE